MDKIKEAQDILKALGLPAAQQNEISALTLLALCDLGLHASWKKARRKSLTITKGVMAFIKKYYGKDYAPNTRETFRRQVLHQFIQAGIVDYNPDKPDLPTNSPRAHYALTEAILIAVRKYGTKGWRTACRKFISQQGSLIEMYTRKRSRHMIPVQLSAGKTLKLSPGRHNRTQVAVVEQFAPRFAAGARLLYFGDTAKKNLFVDRKRLSLLGVAITEHSKLPDVVLHDTKRHWLFLVEVVTSHGPMSPKRVLELDAMFSKCAIGKVYVSAFPNFAEFRRNLRNIAWETEVWIAEIPEHLIHYNGDRFMGPHK